MYKNFLKKTVVFVIFMFGFFLLSESFPTGSANQKNDKELLQQGEELYKNGEYEKALRVFQEAEPYITDTNKQLILYFHMSLTHYALGNSIQAEESLRKVFGLNPGYSVIEENYPRGFINIFNKIKAEIKAKIEAEKKAKEKEKEKEKIIEKPKPKAPKKKKKKFPVLLVVAGVAVVGLVVALLSKKKAEPIQYTLTTTKGEGVDGNPNSGTMTYNQGAVVNYNYSLQNGYKDLEVRLDGTVVS
jgi:tetratricopeptide (TPR) repeat protein